MDIILTDTEVRVLGCLMEKEMATPDYYPLSMNALMNACNQKTNRSPVVAYSEETVAYAINGLKEQRLVHQSTSSRVPKFEQIFSKDLKLVPRERAILAILFVRGPQTGGELRSRSERLYSFQSLEEVQETLSCLEDAKLVKKLPRQPGRKESRYAHLVSGAPVEDFPEDIVQEKKTGTVIVRREGNLEKNSLREQVESLRMELRVLQQEFYDFKSQFD